MRIVNLALVASLVLMLASGVPQLSLACGGSFRADGAGGAPPPSKAELEKLSDKESLVLLRCQTQKVEEDLGPKEGEKYVSGELDRLLRDKKSDSFLQYELAKDGYYCDEKERQEFAAKERKAQRKAEREALWGPPRELQDVDPGLLGGAFASEAEVKYKIDKEHTGYWMGISKNKELEVSTTADSEAELLELAKTLKEEEAEGFDFVRAEYLGGKKAASLDQQTYEANGTICILTSKDGLSLFGDQYPMGPAYEQAKEDFENGDGIVFLGSME
jgi:hypothetical protein